MEEAGCTQSFKAFACGEAHRDARPQNQHQGKPDPGCDFLYNQSVGNLSYDTACCVHGQQNTVLVCDKAQVLTETRDIRVGERLTIQGVEEVAGTAIELDHRSDAVHMRRWPILFLTIRKVSGK